MSFGQNYINKFMFDFESDWTEGGLRAWADVNQYDISNVDDPLVNRRNGSDAGERPVLMLYTPSSDDNEYRLNGYFILRSEATDVYGPEGWEHISGTPEEIIV